MKANDLSAEQERYDEWALRRIIAGELCHSHNFLRCIPSHNKDCKYCYQKDLSEAEGISFHVE